MYFISATRLRLRSVFSLPAFLSTNNAALRQLVITPGFVAGKELVDKGLVFWTLSAWRTDADMKTFRNSAPHKKAMQRLPDWCREATYIHWLQEDATLPPWAAVCDRMITEGMATKVRNPTAHHASKTFPTVKWTKTERIIKPANA